MAAIYSETSPPPHNADAPIWPTYQSGGRRHPVSLYLVPGLQAPGLLDGNDTIYCDITHTREPLGLGVGTLFYDSFTHTDSTAAVSTAAMRMGQQAIRQRILDHVIQETVRAQQILLQAVTALQADDLQRYVSLCHDAEGLTCLLSIRTGWLAGIIAIAGGPEDPLLKRYYRSPRTEVPKTDRQRTRRTR